MTKKEKEIVQEMLQLMEKIRLHTDLMSGSQRIPQLELEVLVSKIKNLYEKATILKYLHLNVDEIVIREVEEKVMEIDQKQGMGMIEPDTAPAIPEASEPETSEPETGTPETMQPARKTEIPEFDIDIEEMSIGDDRGVSVNEKIAGHMAKESMGEKLQKQPVKDLNTVIGLNEKFLFTNELFGGNEKLFTESVAELNKLMTFNEAKTFIETNLQNKFNWNKESAAVDTFMELVGRKFR